MKSFFTGLTEKNSNSSIFRQDHFGKVSNNHLSAYPTPKNLTYGWSFGALSGICLVIQIVTGLFLSMHYEPTITGAFASVENIMRNVEYGWVIRFSHANGASMFFFVLFFHIIRGLFFSSYLKPRASIWISGIVLFLLVMATAFLGYVLPWGQMSLWGATVITNLFSAIPFIGSDIVTILWGSFAVDNPTLNRFYSFHFLLPFIIAGVAIVHLTYLHNAGSSDPLALDSNKNNIHPATVTFFPYFYVKDVYSFFFFFFFFTVLVYYYPTSLGHPDNYIFANPMSTPEHIVPEWYFLPFYAILRSIPNKLLGVIAMGLSIVSLIFFIFYIPVIKSPIFSIFHKTYIAVFVLITIALGYIGQEVAEEPFILVGQLLSFSYFFIIFILIPFTHRYLFSKYYECKFFDFKKFIEKPVKLFHKLVFFFQQPDWPNILLDIIIKSIIKYIVEWVECIISFFTTLKKIFTFKF